VKSCDDVNGISGAPADRARAGVDVDVDGDDDVNLDDDVGAPVRAPAQQNFSFFPDPQKQGA